MNLFQSMAGSHQRFLGGLFLNFCVYFESLKGDSRDCVENGLSGRQIKAEWLLYYVTEVIVTWTKMIAVEIEKSQQILSMLGVELTGLGW